ncbi:MAG: prohibitin family protein [Oligoflexia bacterium]|nr:prohibitin family protein [Bdellovibrionales bacterium]MYE07504.1 prohibitin family protein [Oligoflexia bacterium]
MMKEYRELISFALLGFVLLIGFISLRIVPVGHLGVIKNWGKVTHDNVLAEGWHFVIPVKTTVEYINIKLLKFQDKATASSKDLQDVSTEVSIQYSMNEVSYLYQKVGTKEIVSNIVLMPAVQESVKAVTAKYTAEELIKKRPEVKTEINKAIQEFLNETLNKKGLSEKSLIMANVAITAFDFSEEFNRSIEMKVRAEQQALQAKNEKLKKITDAEAIAEKIKIESIATANAIKREAKALRENPLLIEYKRMEKWDGKLPEVTGGAIPMFDVKKYKENTR